MRTSRLWFLILGATAATASAATLKDWSVLDLSKDAGVFTESKGTKIDLSLTTGPEAGQRAIQLQSDLVEWGGAWVQFKQDLKKVKALRFKAKSSVPGYLMLGLSDDRKTQYIAKVKITSGDWTEFVLPLSYFKRTPWPMEGAPKDIPLNLAKIVSLVLQPQAKGRSVVAVGPISGETGKAKPMTGLPNPDAKTVVVQDFTQLDKGAAGPFSDGKTGTKIELTVGKGSDGEAGTVAHFKYTLKPNGWCGYWLRAGDEWGGQDWTGAKRLICRVYSQEPIFIEFGFNDANQNAYVAHFPKTQGKGWETLSIPFEKFDLNVYYQPPEAKAGAPQDLTHIETFNIAPHTTGDHVFELGLITIEK